MLFDRVARLLPGCEATEDGIDPLEAQILQGKRRTGARFFRRSGAVSDNPLVGVQLVDAVFQQRQRNVYRTGDMPRRK